MPLSSHVHGGGEFIFRGLMWLMAIFLRGGAEQRHRPAAIFSYFLFLCTTALSL